jgi:hypothetical protein
MEAKISGIPSADLPPCYAPGDIDAGFDRKEAPQVKEMRCFMKKSRIELEKEILCKMIFVYCKGHKHGKVPCEECSELTEYSLRRLESCRFGDDKRFCSKCTVHCYEPDTRRRIREVMKYSGPRILFYYPLASVKHLFQK